MVQTVPLENRGRLQTSTRKICANSLDRRRERSCVDRPETDEGKPCYAEQQQKKQKKDAKAKAHGRDHSRVLLFFGVHGR
jgi:hypothetical protein